MSKPCWTITASICGAVGVITVIVCATSAMNGRAPDLDPWTITFVIGAALVQVAVMAYFARRAGSSATERDIVEARTTGYLRGVQDTLDRFQPAVEVAPDNVRSLTHR